MSAHTAGPWQVDFENAHPNNACVHVVLLQEPWHQIASLYNSPTSPLVVGEDGIWPADPEREANARLIAAAPELLAALVSSRETLATAIRHAWEGSTEADIASHITIKKMDAAIAKAIGSQS